MDRFNQYMAMKYGIKAAVVAQFIWDGIQSEEHKEMVREFDNRKWFRCSQLIMTGAMPYLSKHMVHDALHSLLKAKVIAKGCFNDCVFDHTNWYSFTDFGILVMNKGDEENGECEEKL